MTKQEFIKFMSNLMKEKNFIKKGSNYYFDCGNDVLCVLGMYKSNYDNYYYMEYGFVFKSINPKMPFPKYSELNINCGRIWVDGKDAIYYEHVNQEALKQVIHDVVSELVEAGKGGKQKICQIYIPNNFYYIIGQTTLNYLGIDGNGLFVCPETLWS